jgi:hypothetical protein
MTKCRGVRRSDPSVFYKTYFARGSHSSIFRVGQLALYSSTVMTAQCCYLKVHSALFAGESESSAYVMFYNCDTTSCSSHVESRRSPCLLRLRLV